MSPKHITLTVAGVEYIALPKAEYEKLTAPNQTIGEAIEEGVDWARRTIGSDLEKARVMAGLSQEQLAKKLGKTLDKVARAESGAESVGEKFVKAVLKACGLPKDWPDISKKPAKAKPAKEKPVKAAKQKPAKEAPKAAAPAKKAAKKQRTVKDPA